MGRKPSVQASSGTLGRFPLLCHERSRVPPDAGAQPGEQAGAGGGVQGTAQSAKEQVQEKAASLREQAEPRVREEIDRRSTQAGEQVRPMADAFRQSGEQLRGQGNQQQAKLVESVADRAERVSGYLTEADADRVLRDLEDFGRRRPWALAAGGAVIGFLASRFLKASSSRRYESSQAGSWTASRAGEFEPAPPLGLTAETPATPIVAPPDPLTAPALGARADEQL